MKLLRWLRGVDDEPAVTEAVETLPIEDRLDEIEARQAVIEARVAVIESLARRREQA
jgi:hypothetical protein